MKKRNKRAQEYSPEEFDAVVALIKADPTLRADIEAIIGQPLQGKTNRELFDAFRAINEAAAVQEAVVRYGRARQAVRATRAMLAEAALDDLDPADPAAKKIAALETRLDELKAMNARLQATNRALLNGRPRVIKGEVSA